MGSRVLMRSRDLSPLRGLFPFREPTHSSRCGLSSAGAPHLGPRLCERTFPRCDNMGRNHNRPFKADVTGESGSSSSPSPSSSSSGCRCAAPIDAGPMGKRFRGGVVLIALGTASERRRGRRLPVPCGVPFQDPPIEEVLRSVAPPGLASVSGANPQLTLWAIVCRCSAPGATARERSFPGMRRWGWWFKSPTPLKHSQRGLGSTRCNISGKTSAYSAKSPSTVNTGISSRIATAQIRKSVPPPWIPLLRHALYSRAADT